jgi:hypothetical protein
MTNFRWNYRAYMMALVVCTQGSNLAQTPTRPPSRIPLNSGVVQGNTYRNNSLGLELTPARGLQFGTPEMKGTPGSVPLLVTVAAWGEHNWFSANGGTVFYADDLGYYPENRRSTIAYVERVVREQKNEGSELVESTAEGQLGGVTFARADFRRPSKYVVVFVKACDVYAFVFIFAGLDLESVNKLIAQTKVKLDMKGSGCGGAGEGTPQKK